MTIAQLGLEIEYEVGNAEVESLLWRLSQANGVLSTVTRLLGEVEHG